MNIVVEMLAKGYELRTGRHGGLLPGYYAEFVAEAEYICPTCDQMVLSQSWDSCGHGFTLEHAIEQAHAVATIAGFVPLQPARFVEQN